MIPKIIQKNLPLDLKTWVLHDQYYFSSYSSTTSIFVDNWLYSLRGISISKLITIVFSIRSSVDVQRKLQVESLLGLKYCWENQPKNTKVQL